VSESTTTHAAKTETGPQPQAQRRGLSSSHTVARQETRQGRQTIVTSTGSKVTADIIPYHDITTHQRITQAPHDQSSRHDLHITYLTHLHLQHSPKRRRSWTHPNRRRISSYTSNQLDCTVRGGNIDHKRLATFPTLPAIPTKNEDNRRESDCIMDYICC
jgi:hypothetical protein